MQYRKHYLLVFVFIFSSACSSQRKTRLDCVEICKEKGLRFVEVVDADALVNSRTGETEVRSYCRCE